MARAGGIFQKIDGPKVGKDLWAEMRDKISLTDLPGPGNDQNSLMVLRL